MTDETKHRIFMSQMKEDIIDLVQYSFAADIDPAVSWAVFREQLRHFKKDHEMSYQKYLETDAE